MSTTATSRSTAFGIMTVLAHAARALGGAGARIREALGNRWTAKALFEFSDHELADIGLRRADLYCAFAAPVATDPTSELARIAQGRQMWMPARHRCHGEADALPPAVRGRIE